MKLRMILVLAVMALASTESRGQADPDWLKSWNEAQAKRPATMTSRVKIGAEDEPGIPLIIRGKVLESNGTPASGVVVHAYHRDSEGLDFGPNDNTLITWRLQGWVQTDPEGQFEIETIRPAPDHLGREGSHIHFTLDSHQFGRQWAPTVYLADDPRVTEELRQRSKEAGHLGWVRDVNIADGVQHINVNFRLKESADF